MPSRSELRVPAIEVRQGQDRILYSFAVDGKMLPSFATVSRVRRGDGFEVQGYQRPEVLSHIAEIRSYLESVNPMIPNAVVVAFDDRVTFEPLPGNGANGAHGDWSRLGVLVIPLQDRVEDWNKPGWIVDGQQRLAAIREARIKSFPICVVAFVTSDDKEQREQFILVNSTKPLPKGLIYELLPTTEAKLPSLLQRRRFPAFLLDRLNHDEDSPLKDMIRTPTATKGVIKDNSVLKMLENSLSDGVLYRFRDPQTGEGDAETMLRIVKAFWSAVKTVFKSAWALPPRRSRLMHGAGIVAMGFLMDRIADRYREVPMPTEEHFLRDLEPLKDVCRWTDGYWEFGPGNHRKWSEIQNTSKDIQLLVYHLQFQYKSRVVDRAAASPKR